MSKVTGNSNKVWSYLPTTMPTGASAAEAQWQFDNTASELVDRTGNGHDLTLTTGTSLHVYKDDLVGLAFSGLEYYTAALPTNLRILAALSVEVLYMVGTVPAVRMAPWYCGGNPASDLEAENSLHTIYISATYGRHSYFSEHGAGVNDQVDYKTIVLNGNIELLTLTRSAAGATCLYQNGQLVDSGAITIPTGGGNGIFVIGWERNAASYFRGAMFGMRVSAQVLTAAQVAEVYAGTYK